MLYSIVLVAASRKSRDRLEISLARFFHQIQSTSNGDYETAGASILAVPSIDVHNQDVQTRRRYRRTRAIERKRIIGKHEFRRDSVKTPLGRRLISSWTAANDVSSVNAHADEHSTFFSLHSTRNQAF